MRPVPRGFCKLHESKHEIQPWDGEALSHKCCVGNGALPVSLIYGRWKTAAPVCTKTN